MLALNHITLPVLAPSTLDSPQSLYYSLLRLIKIITFINAILKNLTQTWYWNWVRKQSSLHNDSVILHTVLTPCLSQLRCSSTNTWVHVWGYSPGRVFRSSDGLNEWVCTFTSLHWCSEKYVDLIDGRQYWETFHPDNYEKWKYPMVKLTLMIVDQKSIIHFTQFEATIWGKHNAEWLWNKISKIMILF